MLFLRNSLPALILPARRVGLAVGLLLAICLAALLEQQQPFAAIVVLLVVTASIGIFHGVLDVVLLLGSRTSATVTSTATAYRSDGLSTRSRFALYGTAVALMLIMFASEPGFALIALLLMSIWHFGEVFDVSGQRRTEPMWFVVGERLTLGAASVVLPRLLDAASLRETVSFIGANSHATVSAVWSIWSALLVMWLVIGCFWFVASAVRLHRMNATSADATALAKRLRWVAIHTAVLCMVFAILSPVMGFAAYFGLYHSPAHIRRVLRAYPTAFTHTVAWQLGAIYAFTIVIAAAVFFWIRLSSVTVMMTPALLQMFVIVIAAISLPHIVLISHRAHELQR